MWLFLLFWLAFSLLLAGELHGEAPQAMRNPIHPVIANGLLEKWSEVNECGTRGFEWPFFHRQLSL